MMNDDLKELQKSFHKDASLLGDYKSLDKSKLANGYCDAEEAMWKAQAEGDELEATRQATLRSAYNSALMLRYWYKIYEWRENSSTLHLEDIEFVEWLRKGIWVALYYKSWRGEYKEKYEEGKFMNYVLDANGAKIPNDYYWGVDYNAPDKIINRCLASIRGREFQYHNKDKRNTNTQAFSLDHMLEDAGDSVIDMVDYSSEDNLSTNDATKYIISSLLKRQEGIGALIIDGIAYRDSQKVNSVKHTETVWNDEKQCNEEVTYATETSEFNPRKLVAHLSHIDKNFMKRFCSLYNIDKEEGNLLYNKLKAMSNSKLYEAIDNTLNEIKNDSDLSVTLSK